MTPREICNLFGGVTATSRVIGLKSNRYLRRVIADGKPMPKNWYHILRNEAVKRGTELLEFGNGELE